MTRWHPAAVLLIGITTTGVLGAWFYAYMNGSLSARELSMAPLTYLNVRMLLRLQKGTP